MNDKKLSYDEQIEFCINFRDNIEFSVKSSIEKDRSDNILPYLPSTLTLQNFADRCLNEKIAKFAYAYLSIETNVTEEYPTVLTDLRVPLLLRTQFLSWLLDEQHNTVQTSIDPLSGLTFLSKAPISFSDLVCRIISALTDKWNNFCVVWMLHLSDPENQCNIDIHALKIAESHSMYKKYKEILNNNCSY